MKISKEKRKVFLRLIRRNWIFSKPFKYNYQIFYIFVSKNYHKIIDLDLKKYFFWLSYIYGYKEPNGMIFDLSILFEKNKLNEYKLFLFDDDNSDKLLEIVEYYYDKFPIQKLYRTNGYNKVKQFLNEHIDKYSVNDFKNAIDKIDKNNHNPWDIINILTFNENNTEKNTRGNWDTNKAEQNETKKYYDKLENKDITLSLNDRGRKLLITTDWGIVLMEKLYWCKKFLEEYKNKDISGYIEEYDKCKDREERYEVIRKYEPESFNDEFECEYELREKELKKYAM